MAMAQEGNRDSLTALIRAVQDSVYHLSIRMLVRPEDAEDATQEILILVTTKLSSFEARSSFRTWVYRVAMSYLISSKKVLSREMGLTFANYKDDLLDGLVDDRAAKADDLVMMNELRVACTMAMLLCLDLKHRAAYVLGKVLELSHEESAEILDITSDNFRQRLSRASKKVQDFTTQYCGLANPDAPCSCPRRLPAALSLGRIGRPVFYSGGNTPDYLTVQQEAHSLIRNLRTLKLQQATQSFTSPRDFGNTIYQLVNRT
ncbi:MAG: sigma-70 family RNA polymerase sigma factor [Armatimonadetes bacterium]|nr:sigma-70 family RNA polymerase sigma factor [Armatimonadota bacterium]